MCGSSCPETLDEMDGEMPVMRRALIVATLAVLILAVESFAAPELRGLESETADPDRISADSWERSATNRRACLWGTSPRGYPLRPVSPVAGTLAETR